MGCGRWKGPSSPLLFLPGLPTLTEDILVEELVPGIPRRTTQPLGFQSLVNWTPSGFGSPGHMPGYVEILWPECSLHFLTASPVHVLASSVPYVGVGHEVKVQKPDLCSDSTCVGEGEAEASHPLHFCRELPNQRVDGAGGPGHTGFFSKTGRPLWLHSLT